jgi:HEAT repeat protein
VAGFLLPVPLKIPLEARCNRVVNQPIMNKPLKYLSFLVVMLSAIAATSFLSGCGGPSKPKIDVTAQIEALKDPDESKKQDALTALSEAGPAAAPAVPTLIQTLKDPDPLSRRLAALALGNIGKPAASALPELKNLLTDNDRAVVMNAMNALRAIDPSSVDATNPPNVMSP